jgi:hypothetical protein
MYILRFVISALASTMWPVVVATNPIRKILPSWALSALAQKMSATSNTKARAKRLLEVPMITSMLGAHTRARIDIATNRSSAASGEAVLE